jgi:3-phenylpropionate/trans-cinnamate dioxygenase ferredoxin reductase subunit
MVLSRGMVIVGAGHVGGRAAQALRDAGWRGPLTLVGAEETPPYERPPLSKGLLTGEKTAEECLLFAASSYAERGIDFLAGRSVAAIDRGERSVLLSDGARIAYERLLLATGAEPRRLDVPGAALAGVFTLRTIPDSKSLRAHLAPGKRIVIIGGGFIGLEVASNAVALGAHVTVVEAAPRLMTRTVPAPIEARMQARHREAGVVLHLGRQVAAIEGGTAVTGVRLDDGSAIPCEAVLVSIGVTPRTGLAAEAGLAVDNGIVVDATLRTDDPHVFAAGDACAFAHPLFGGHIRLESWKNAEDHGPIAARNMLGGAESASAVPWMWSDQYELTIQIAGLPDLAARSIERPLGDGALLLFHLAEDGRMVAASGVGPNSAIGRAVRLGQMMIERSLYPDERLIADPSVNLKTLVREQAA